MSVNGLALGGGGGRGSYEIGVWKCLRELGWEPDIITGTSVGSLNGALMVQDDFEAGLDLWLNIENDQVIELEHDNSADDALNLLATAETYLKSITTQEKGLSTAPLRVILDNYVDEDKIRTAKTRFGLITVLWEPPKLTPKELYIEDMEKGYLTDYLLASSSLYPALQAHIIDGKAYVDGGYYDNIPINMTLKAGADYVLAVDLDAVGFTKEIKADEGQTIVHIKPYWDLGGLLNFSGKTSARNINLGYLDTLKIFNKAKGCCYTFENQSFTQLSADSSRKLKETQDAIELEDKKTLLPTTSQGIAKTVEKKYRGNLTIDRDLWQITAEAAGEVFGLSPEKLYTEQEFTDQVTKAVKKYILQAKVYDNFGFSKGQSLKKKLKFADAAGRCLAIYKNMSKEGEEKVSMLQEATVFLFPLEFLAAIFLYITNIKI